MNKIWKVQVQFSVEIPAETYKRAKEIATADVLPKVMGCVGNFIPGSFRATKATSSGAPPVTAAAIAGMPAIASQSPVAPSEGGWGYGGVPATAQTLKTGSTTIYPALPGEIFYAEDDIPVSPV
jgi:hypothetical protein